MDFVSYVERCCIQALVNPGIIANVINCHHEVALFPDRIGSINRKTQSPFNAINSSTISTLLSNFAS
jgi:hypothetical protein